MDGSFCPQLTVGPAFIAAAASAGVPVDAHLLVDEPARFLPEVVAAGAAIVTVHAEASRHPHRVLSELTALSAEVRPVIRGYALNPGTPLRRDRAGARPRRPGAGAGGRTRAGRGRRPRRTPPAASPPPASSWRGADHPVLVGVDGGVTLRNAAQVASWGADLVVSGSAIFDGRDPAGNLSAMLAALGGT